MLLLWILAAIAATGTLFLPRLLLLPWLAITWAPVIYIMNFMDLSDDPAFLSAAIVVGPFLFLNGVATLCRVTLELISLGDHRGYGD